VIYKRGVCDKDGPNATCSKCGKRRSCGVYWYKIKFKGELFRESSKQSSRKVARMMEAAHRTSLAKGEVGIREKRSAPTLRDFLQKTFLPYAATKHAAKPATYRYYRQGCDMLLKSHLSNLRIDEINDSHAQAFAAQLPNLSASGINRGLRTLRYSLNRAYQWNTLERPAKMNLVTGEVQRDRYSQRPKRNAIWQPVLSLGATLPRSSSTKECARARSFALSGSTYRSPVVAPCASRRENRKRRAGNCL
jgi:hypothetical protein